MITVGMTKAQVESIYGEPQLKRDVIDPEWKEPREEWYYKATYSALPVGAGHLAEDLYLYFDGENLTNITRTPLGKSVKEESSEDARKSSK